MDTFGCGWKPRYDILPVALLDYSQSCDFTVNYDNLNLGLTKNSAFFPSKTGQRLMVEACSLDELISTYDFQRPNLIKMDIEGAEATAVRGMMNTLMHARPILILELHGKAAALATLSLLDSIAYRYQETEKYKLFHSAQELVDWMPEACIQVVALPTW